MQPLSRHKHTDAGAGSAYSHRGCSHNRPGHTDISVRQPQLLLTVVCQCSASLDVTSATQRLSTPEEKGPDARPPAGPAHGHTGQPEDLTLYHEDTSFTARQHVSSKS